MEEKPQVPKIFVPKITLDEGKKTPKTPFAVMTPMGRGRLQKQSSAKSNCLCSPTTHAGSFRCRLHRTSGLGRASVSVGSNLSELAAKSVASISNSVPAQ